MIKLTEQREITPNKWVHLMRSEAILDDERAQAPVLYVLGSRGYFYFGGLISTL